MDYQAIILNEDDRGLPRGQGNGILLDSEKGIVATVAHGVKRGRRCRVFLKDRAYSARFQHESVDWQTDMALVTLEDTGDDILPDPPVAIDELQAGAEVVIPGFLPRENDETRGILRSYYNLNVSKEICPAFVKGKVVAMHQSLARMGLDSFFEEMAVLQQTENGFSTPIEKTRLFYDDYIILKIEGLDQQLARGLSGSPVADAEGRVIGIFSIILNDEDLNMAAAIPVSVAQALVVAFKETRKSRSDSEKEAIP
jgi:hypothetical protein